MPGSERPCAHGPRRACPASRRHLLIPAGWRGRVLGNGQFFKVMLCPGPGGAEALPSPCSLPSGAAALLGGGGAGGQASGSLSKCPVPASGRVHPAHRPHPGPPPGRGGGGRRGETGCRRDRVLGRPSHAATSPPAPGPRRAPRPTRPPPGAPRPAPSALTARSGRARAAAAAAATTAPRGPGPAPAPPHLARLRPARVGSEPRRPHCADGETEASQRAPVPPPVVSQRGAGLWDSG